ISSSVLTHCKAETDRRGVFIDIADNLIRFPLSRLDRSVNHVIEKAGAGWKVDPKPEQNLRSIAERPRASECPKTHSFAFVATSIDRLHQSSSSNLTLSLASQAEALFSIVRLIRNNRCFVTEPLYCFR